MSKTKKIWIFTLVLALLCSLFLSISFWDVKDSKADDVRFSKKVVSVLFDDSGSMVESRFAPAQYATQMLMSFLDEKDTLIITPLNASKFEVDLKVADREAVIKSVISNSFLGNSSGSGQTPSDKMDDAVYELVNRGMKPQDKLLEEDPDTEYWFIILTDGEFDNVSDMTYQENLIEGNIKNYPSMHTIHISLGSGAVSMKNSGLCNKYMFSAYTATNDLSGDTDNDPNTESIVKVMQKIANQMSGRYELPSTAYTISGSTVTVDLDKCDFSLKSLTVMAQNCGAKISSATYNGNSITIDRQSVIKPQGALSMKDGVSALIKGSPYLSGGTLVLEFTAPVNDISILVEPALYILPILMRYDGNDWVQTDMQYINSHLGKNDQIRVDYAVYEQAQGKEIDLETLFGTPETQVTYAGNRTKCGIPFSLVEGINEIGISISVMDGTYTLYASMTCVIEENPTYYRVEADYDDTIDNATYTGRTVYTVFANNVAQTKAQLSDYTFEIKVTDFDGMEVPTTMEIATDGKITVKSTVTAKKYGIYTEYFKVFNKQGLSRDFTIEKSYMPQSVEVKVVEGQDLTMSAHQFENNSSPIKFEMYSDGTKLDFGAWKFGYNVKLDGKDVTAQTTVDNGILIYVPKASDLDRVSLGDKKAVLTVTDKNGQTLATSDPAVIKITATIFVVEALSTDDVSVDRFKLKDTDASLLFKITRDGEDLTVDELQQLLDQGQISVKDDGTFSGFIWLPCGTELSVKEVNGQAVVVVGAKSDIFSPIDTFLAMLIFSGREQITLSCNGGSASSHFVFGKSPIFEYIWRILVILFIIYLILYLIGFKKSEMFPSGTFICLSFSDGEDVRAQRKCVNIERSGIILWHIKRFFIFWKLTWIKQKGQKYFSMIETQFVKGKDGPQIGFRKQLVSVAYYAKANNDSTNFDKFVKAYKQKKYSGGKVQPSEVSSDGLRAMYKISNDKAATKEKGHFVKLKNEAHFAQINEDGQIERVVFFVKKHK